MTKGIKKTAVEKQLENLKHLKSLGFQVPDMALGYLEEQRRIEEGVYEILECKPCKTQVEMYIPSKFAMCRCGKNLVQTWVNPKWGQELGEIQLTPVAPTIPTVEVPVLDFGGLEAEATPQDISLDFSHLH